MVFVPHLLLLHVVAVNLQARVTTFVTVTVPVKVAGHGMGHGEGSRSKCMVKDNSWVHHHIFCALDFHDNPALGREGGLRQKRGKGEEAIQRKRGEGGKY